MLAFKRYNDHWLCNMILVSPPNGGTTHMIIALRYIFFSIPQNHPANEVSQQPKVQIKALAVKAVHVLLNLLTQIGENYIIGSVK